MTVDYVHDGDTLFLDSGLDGVIKVRLVGVDTPELQPASECFADEATTRLRELAVEGDTVWVEPDVEPLDHYGRSLLYVWTAAGVFVNLTLVEDGYAEAIRVGDNDAWWPELSGAEQRARSNGRGMWGSCPS